MKRKSNLFSLILFFACVIFFSGELFAKDNDSSSDSSPQVIRVAYPIQDALTEKDEDGNYSGYTYDYLQEIAQYTGWEYEFVEVDGSPSEMETKMLSLLNSGEIDLIGSLHKTEQTKAFFDFPEYGYGNSFINLCVSEDNSQINEMNIFGIQNLRIAADVNDSKSKSKAEEFCKLNNISFSFVDCETPQLIAERVQNGEADVMLLYDLSPLKGFRTVAQFSGSQFYFGVPNGRSDLVSTLNSTILTIKQTKPYFESTLHETYFSSHAYMPYMTDEETDFVNSSDPLRIAFVTNVAPIQYLDSKNNIAGISKAILERISEDTGLKMTFLPVDSFREAYKMLDQNKADAICGIPYDYETAQDHNLVMSNSFLTSQMVMATGKDSDDSNNQKTVAVLKGREVENADSNATPLSCDTVQECMDYVSSGKADYSYMNFYSAEYLDHFSNYRNLTFIPQGDKTLEYCLGFSKPSNSMLVALINRSLSNISASDMETLIYKNTVGTYNQVTLRSFVEQNPFFSIGILSTIFFIFAMILLLFFRVHTQANKRLHIENERYLFLSELANEYIYEYNFKKDTLSFSKEFSRLFSLPETISHILKCAPEADGTDLNPEIIKLLKEATSMGETAHSEHLYHLPDGSSRWFRNTKAEIKDTAGRRVYIIGKLTDIQNEMEEKEHLKLQSQLDALTGLYNAAFTKKLIQERLTTVAGPCALLILDLDTFKSANDILGHYTGDIILKEFSQVLNALAKPADIVGRIGGDEFMFFLDSAPTLQSVETFCENLCHRVCKTYTGEKDENLTITTSIGGIRIENAKPFDDLYQTADKLLYKSKGKGRNCYTIEDD